MPYLHTGAAQHRGIINMATILLNNLFITPLLDKFYVIKSYVSAIFIIVVPTMERGNDRINCLPLSHFAAITVASPFHSVEPPWASAY
jgi:hypothetical protein